MSPAFQPRPGAGIPLAVLAFGLALGAGVAIANGLEFVAAPLVAASAAVCVVAAGGARTGYPAVFIPIAAAWSEAAVFASAAWLLGGEGNHAAAFGAFAATTGALAQSYTVARGAVVGVDVAEGPVRQAVRPRCSPPPSRWASLKPPSGPSPCWRLAARSSPSPACCAPSPLPAAAANRDQPGFHTIRSCPVAIAFNDHSSIRHGVSFNTPNAGSSGPCIRIVPGSYPSVPEPP